LYHAIIINTFLLVANNESSIFHDMYTDGLFENSFYAGSFLFTVIIIKGAMETNYFNFVTIASYLFSIVSYFVLFLLYSLFIVFFFR